MKCLVFMYNSASGGKVRRIWANALSGLHFIEGILTVLYSNLVNPRGSSLQHKKKKGKQADYITQFNFQQEQNHNKEQKLS